MEEYLIEDDVPNIELVTESGVFHAQFSTDGESCLDVHDLVLEDLELFREWADNVRLLVSDYLEGKKEVSFEVCDAAYKEWLFSPEPRYEVGRVVALVGAYLGERCVEDLGMRWVRISDEQGEEYAVMHDGADVISYPFACVRKRIGRCEYGFLEAVFHTVKHAIRSSGWDMRSSKRKKSPEA